jgi:hypothetical protein
MVGGVRLVSGMLLPLKGLRIFASAVTAVAFWPIPGIRRLCYNSGLRYYSTLASNIAVSTRPPRRIWTKIRYLPGLGNA